MRAGYPLDRRGRPIPDGSWPGRCAPGALESLRRFLNTTSRESAAELLDGAHAARQWLADEGHDVGGRLGPADVALLIEARECLRALAGEQQRSAATDEALTRLGVRGAVVVRLTPEPDLVPLHHGVPAFVARMLVIARDAMLDGSWPRLKPCANDRCRWFFYDGSRNATGRWCATAVCGSRAKARAYRSRKKDAHAP